MKLTVSDFFEQARGIRGNDLVQYWRKISADWPNSDRLEFAVQLAQNDAWYWDPILDYVLISENPKDGYAVLSGLMEKAGVGAILVEFKKRCQKETTFADQYIVLLDKETDFNSAKFAGLLIALSFMNTPKEWTELEWRLSSQDKYKQTSAAFALRVLDAEKKNKNITPSVSKKVFEQIEKNDGLEVREHLVWFFVSHFDLVEVQQATNCLDVIIKDRASLWCLLLAIARENPVPLKIRFEILAKTVASGQENLEDLIGSCLAAWGTEQVSESLKMIKDIAIRNFHHIPATLAWATETIGQKKVGDSIEVVKSWLTESVSEQEKMIRELFLYPDFIVSLTRQHKSKLAETLKELSKEERNDRLVIATIQDYMKSVDRKPDWTPVNNEDDDCLQACVECLRAIAARRGKNSKKFPGEKERKIFQCGQLVELIEETEHTPKPELVKASSEEYPNVARFLDVLINLKEVGPVSPSPLFVLLGSDRCGVEEYLERIRKAEIAFDGGKLEVARWKAHDALRRHCLLIHMDQCLSRIDKTESGTSELRKKLVDENESHFWSAYSEIEVIGKLREYFTLQLSEESEVVSEETILLKRPDISINFDGGRIRVEVITPQMTAILRYLGGGGIPNRLTGMIISEFDKHFRGQKEDRDAIIIVDATLSEIDNWSGISSVRGTPGVELKVDKASGKVVASRTVFAKNSISEREPQTELILGVLIYKRLLDESTGNMALMGKFFPNIHSRAPNKFGLCAKIERGLLDEIIDDS